MMEAAIARADLYAVVLDRLAAATGVTRAEWPARTGYEPVPQIEEAWLRVYRQPRAHWALYQLAEKLVDIDDSLLTWRYRHVVTVERVIGMKRGTGGSDGVSYLQSTLSRRAFPELWSLRTKL
jgi:tryptophan 2,3-dioxygenase